VTSKKRICRQQGFGNNQSPAVFMLQERPVICPAPSCENGRKLIYSKVVV
jgi:hypothetical protein